MLVRAPGRVQLRLSGTPQIRLDGQALDPGTQLLPRLLERRGATMLNGASSHAELVDLREQRQTLALVKTEVRGVRELPGR